MDHYRNGIILGIVALVIAVGTPAFSAKPTPTPQLIIQSVTVQTNTLQINGGNLDNGDTLTVTLAGTPLTVTSSDSKQIVASLSSTPAAGTYKLTVVTGTASTQRGEFYVTIGAVGNLGVYDGSGLLLGYLVDSPNPDRYRVFNPTIPAFLNLWFRVPISFENDPFCFLMFTTTDCSSQPYIHSVECGFYSVCVYGNFIPNIYYIYDDQSQFPVVPLSDIQSYRHCETGDCIHASWPGDPRAVYPVKQIDVPLFNQTLQYPIVVRPTQ